MPAAVVVQPAREDICIVDGAKEHIYTLLLLKTVSQYDAHFTIRSDNYSSVLSSLKMFVFGETDRPDSVNIILISCRLQNAYEHSTQTPPGGVGRSKCNHVIVANVLRPLPNHHIYRTGILSQLLNNISKCSTLLSVSETEAYIHRTLKDRLLCVGLNQFDLSGKANSAVCLNSPMLQCNGELDEVKLCVSVTHIYQMSIHRLDMICDLWKEVLQTISESSISLILFLAHTHDGINRTNGSLTNDDHKNDVTIPKSCFHSNIVQLLQTDTPIVFRCVVIVDWRSIDRRVFRLWPMRELIPGHHVISVLKRILEYSKNTQALNKHEYDLKVHVSEISNDASEVQPRDDVYPLVQILWLLAEISYMTKRFVDNILQKIITTKSIVFSDDKGNGEGVSDQKTVVHNMDQLQALYLCNDTSQYLSEAHEEDIPSMFDKREAYNLFLNFTDKSLEYTFPSCNKKAGEQVKYVDKDSLYGDGFTRYLNTWQEVRVAPFYSLRHYFKKLETGENDEKMTYEALRLGSYCGINMNASCIRLAEAGFYATGDGDETKCFSCGVRHRDWQRKDNPVLIHRQIAPLCPLITGDDRRNVPINPHAVPSSFSVLSAEANPVAGHDAGFAFGANTDEVLNNQLQMPETYPTISAISYVSCDGGDKGASASPDLLDPFDRAAADAGQDHTAYILRFEDAVYPNYGDIKVRMTSFQMWPQDHCKRPEELVPAGFFYAGYSDCVRCFVCGVGLKTWEEGDDPWMEHVRWRSSCAYVKAIKGDLFVTQTLAVVGQKLRTEQTSTNAGRRRAEMLSDRNDSGDILDREACQRALEMGYSRDCVRKHALYILTNQGTDSLKLHLLVERILLEDVTEPTAATIHASSVGLPPTVGHVLPAPRGETDTPPTQPQSPSGQPQGQGESDEEDHAYKDTMVPTTFSSGNKFQSMPILSSDRNTIPSAKSKIQNKTSEEESTEEETQQLKQSSACKICLEDPANVVFLPCGHLVACAMCAPALERCPVCRKHIRGTVRVHMADMSSVTTS